jgi:hypothetical protein
MPPFWMWSPEIVCTYSLVRDHSRIILSKHAASESKTLSISNLSAARNLARQTQILTQR